MTKSTFWNNLHKRHNVVIAGDLKPWGGVSNLDVMDGARINGINIQVGSTFDTATIVYDNKDIGDEIPYFKPVKVMVAEDAEGQSLDTNLTTIFRGFVVGNSGTANQDEEKVSVTLHGYKWYLSRRTKIRGRWYAIEGSDGVPDQLGSGVAIGAAKFTYERFRGSIASDGGYLQNVPCVFNRNGIPDCFNNSAGARSVFFYPKTDYSPDEVGWSETDGLREQYWQAREWEGVFWTWASILRHIEYYWIKPYELVQTGIEFSVNDLAKIDDITNDKPLDFSIEGMNPLGAIDKVVNEMPGKWVWWVDYSQVKIRIRIKEITDVDDNEIFLKLPEQGEKLAEESANLSQLEVTRNGEGGSKYAISYGEPIKLITTVKLVPLWPRYTSEDGTNMQDFKDFDDFSKWRKYIQKKYYSTESSVSFNVDLLDESEIARYDRIYRSYGIALDGETFADQIVDIGDGIELPGGIQGEYSEYETVLTKLFFKNIHKLRMFAPPAIQSYSGEYQVFLWDEDHNDVPEKIKDANETVVLSEDQQRDFANMRQWVTGKEVDFEVDEKNGVVTFERPQFRRRAVAETWGKDGKENESQEALLRLSRIKENLNYDLPEGSDPVLLHNGMVSRDVYMTAMFQTDVASVFGRKTDHNLIDEYSGAPFPVYLDRADVGVIVHKNAFYPYNLFTTDGEGGITYSTDTMDGHAIGQTIVKGEDLPDYRELVGDGAYEMLRALMAFLKGYNRLQEDVSAVIPYLETGFGLGQELKKIHNTKYTDLNCVLFSINWRAEDDSDTFSTTLSLSNFYDKEKPENVRAQQKENEEKAELGNRDIFTFPNYSVDTDI